MQWPSYFTVSVMEVCCETEPAVAVMTTVDCPVGVGVIPVVPLPVQPTRKLPTASEMTSAESTRSAAADLLMRRRLMNISDANGSSIAVIIPAPAPSRTCGDFTRAVAMVVWIVTVLVATAVDETVKELGEKEHVALIGKPLHARVTVPLNPFTGATLSVAVVEFPAVTVAAPADALKPMVGVLPATVVLAIPAKRPCASPARPAVKKTVLVSPPLTEVVPLTLVPPVSSSHRLG